MSDSSYSYLVTLAALKTRVDELRETILAEIRDTSASNSEPKLNPKLSSRRYFIIVNPKGETINGTFSVMPTSAWAKMTGLASDMEKVGYRCIEVELREVSRRVKEDAMEDRIKDLEKGLEDANKRILKLTIDADRMMHFYQMTRSDDV